MKNKLVAAGMSGGADSTYAAYILKKQGYKVIGIMAKFWSCGNGDGERSNICCTPESLDRARENAKKIGIDFYLIDLSKEFKEKVVDYYIDEYKHFRTPNPCVVCNTEIKFGMLHDAAIKLGADYIATGHYAQIEDLSKFIKSKVHKVKKLEEKILRQAQDDTMVKGLILKRAEDKTKDQTYFLWQLTQNQLRHSLFPLGEIKKDEVLRIIKKEGFAISNKESQDICFLGGFSNEDFLKKYIKLEAGDIKTTDGKIIGRHNGLYGCTIGQRHGIGVNLSEPSYIISLDEKTNSMIVGSAEELERKEFTISNMNWFISEDQRNNLIVMTRYNQTPVSCTVLGNKVFLESKLKAITAGQSAVFYKDNLLVGGGIIE
ncbi:MAG: tRNA 2-thiouridine(34) synthase MnmA [Patescibacteria group bacterium]|jgi:tRNA-specific 2-thiouridylase